MITIPSGDCRGWNCPSGRGLELTGLYGNVNAGSEDKRPTIHGRFSVTAVKSFVGWSQKIKRFLFGAEIE